MQAIEQVTANPKLHTGDLGGKATTAEVTARRMRRTHRQREQATGGLTGRARSAPPRFPSKQTRGRLRAGLAPIRAQGVNDAPKQEREDHRHARSRKR